MKHITCLVFATACFAAPHGMAQKNNKPVFNHLAILVVDLNTSADFYMNTIGFDSIPEPFHDKKHVWLSVGTNNALHIIQGAVAKKEYYKNNHICFSVGSLEAFIDNLKKKGVAFEDINGKKNVFSSRPDGVKQLWLRDPDGYWLEINDARE
jgi:lactoylglutathione lyase